jgi:DNA-binding NarL/FixJ family response regulator
VVEDNRLLREGLAAMLKEQSDIACATCTGNPDALTKGRRFSPDVILLDLGFRSQSALRVVGSITSGLPGARIIVMDLAPVQTELVE